MAKIKITQSNGTVIESNEFSLSGMAVDSELSDSSTNPVQNKVITEALTHVHIDDGELT